MLYLHRIANLILIFDVFESPKINYARGLLGNYCQQNQE
jgi:hypothetical protein